MSMVLDPNQPWTDEQKAWARDSGRAHLITANERRFPGGVAEAAEDHEAAGDQPVSPVFGTDGAALREAATYDVGGAPLPGSTLDYDTGRGYGFDEDDNGVLVEPNPPKNSPGAFAHSLTPEAFAAASGTVATPEGFTSTPEGGDDIDADIVEHVVGLKNKAEVLAELKNWNEKFPQFAQEPEPGDGRDDLNDKLALVMQDARHPDVAEKMRLLASKAQPVAVDDDAETEATPNAE